MAVWGISCHLDRGEPTVVAMSATGPRSSLSGEEVFRHRANPKVTWGEKLRELAAHLEAALFRAKPDAVVVRSMDWTKFRKESTARPHYQVEGVLLEVATRLGVPTQALSGKEIGKLLGTTKAQAEAEAKVVFTADEDAGAAAIAALTIVGQA